MRESRPGPQDALKQGTNYFCLVVPSLAICRAVCLALCQGGTVRILGCLCHAESRLPGIRLALLIPARLPKPLLQKNFAESTVPSVCVSGYCCLPQLVDFLMYHNWELICEQQHLEKINCVWNVQ